MILPHPRTILSPERWLEDERASIDAELSQPVTITRPRLQTGPIIFCSPHSGRTYPKAFLAASRLDALPLRRSEDAYVDELFAASVAHGAPLLAANFPRAYLDVNREPLELDPRLIEGPLPRGANTQSARVAGGLGTIPRLVADGEMIYAGRLPVQIAMLRIERLYHPFHYALGSLIAETQRRFGVAIVVDCHSMPSISAGQEPSKRPHFVIGDRFGTSCAAEIMRTAVGALSASGCEVHANRPYAGGFITEHYGRPHARVHTIQVEINRALYLNEATLERSADFATCAAVVEELVRSLTALAEAWVRPHGMAAE
jgi:N-formylglutamate amidohydrolase